MENENNTPENGTPTPEELQEEQESLAEVKDDDLRSSVVTSLGLEETDDNKDLIDKLVEHEKGNRQKLSKAIGSKIKYRELANTKNGQSTPDEQQPAKSKTELDADAIRKEATDAAFNTINENFIEESDYSDEFKSKLRDELARNPGKTAQSLLKNSEYLQFHLKQEEDAKRAAEAANNGNGERKGADDGSEGMPDKFNDATFMATEEGQKEYAEWEKSQK